MREITIWEADDGTKFDDEYECAKYEFAQQVEKYRKCFGLLGSQYNLLDPAEPGSYEDAYFIYLPNSESAKILRNLYCNDSVISVNVPDFLNDWNVDAGLWVYDDNDDNWYHLGEKIAELQDMADQCMETVNQGL